MQLEGSGPRRSDRASWLGVLALIGGCGDGLTDAGGTAPAEFRLLTAPALSGTPGWVLSDSVVVEVLDRGGNPVSGVTVSWTADNDADAVEPAADTTNVAGRASAAWTLGRNEGAQTLAITAGDLQPIAVTATATVFHADTVSVGYGFACALRDGGRAFCWGANYAGQLGNGTVGEPVYVPGPVAGGLAFATVTTSGTHACGLTEGGAAYCWGSNARGEMGIGAAGVGIPTPTPVQTALTFTRISADGVTGDNTVCALTEAGEAWCWGSNRGGRLGDGTTNDSPVPVRVQSDVPFTAIRSGTDHGCGTEVGGELWCWGEQESTPGALGARPAGGYPTPVLVLEDFEFVSLSLGWNYACGLTAQQGALCWGTNWFGGLGHASSDGSDVPLPVDGGHTFAAISAAGYKETHGLTTDGLIYRWGTSGTEAPEPTPILVTGHRFVMIESGEEPFDGWYGACGLSAGNAVYCVRDDGLVRGVPAPAGP